MSDRKVLVVCEGPTDFVIIDGIFKHIGDHLNKTFELKLLSPQVDATTGNAEPHGWTAVKKWCELHAIKDPAACQHLPEPVRRTVLSRNWEALVAASSSDLLLVQLDTDIAHLADVTFDQEVETRRACCERKLNLWLGITHQNPKCRYLLPTYAIETWLLATHDSSSSPGVFQTTPQDYEAIPDYENKLLTLGYFGKDFRGRRRLNKKPRHYKDNDLYLRRLLAHLNVASRRCQELSSFITVISNV